MVAQEFFKWISLGFIVVLVGVILKDAQGANTIMTGFGNSYSGILKTLEGAG
jgi:hypothetical protein